jgi:hypothetical protein
MALSELYSRIRATSFSKDVLSVQPNDLAVLRAQGLGWSDLGEPNRVRSVLDRKGVQAEWRLRVHDSTAEALLAGKKATG